MWPWIVLAGVAAIALLVTYELWLRPGGEEVVVRIPPGSSFETILDSLERSGVVGNRSAFRMLAMATGRDAKIQPGTYRFREGTAAAELLDALVEGRSTVKVRVTFPEGITIRRMASIAERTLGVDSARFIALATDREFLRTIGINAPTAEGYLMPDTYFLFWGEEPELLLRRLADEFLTFYDGERKSRTKEVGLDPYEAIILASIVEGEAAVAEERPVIAGLYLNRLRRGMKLGADPTIQYVLKDGPRRLRFSDYKIDSPYNTYQHMGLPPTPINNPGRGAVDAVLSPADHDYVYMVARGDGSGRHTFTRTGTEHERARQEYLRRLRETGQ